MGLERIGLTFELTLCFKTWVMGEDKIEPGQRRKGLGLVIGVDKVEPGQRKRVHLSKDLLLKGLIQEQAFGLVAKYCSATATHTVKHRIPSDLRS